MSRSFRGVPLDDPEFFDRMVDEFLAAGPCKNPGCVHAGGRELERGVCAGCLSDFRRALARLPDHLRARFEQRCIRKGMIGPASGDCEVLA